MDLTWHPSPNYSSRKGVAIKYLIPHYTAGTSFDGAYSTLCNPSRHASAHYLVEGEKVWQLVSEDDCAWHCGNLKVNQQSLGVELVGNWDYPPTVETMTTCAELFADFSRRYFGGSELVLGWEGNVLLHKWVVDTDCPGPTDYQFIVDKANELLGYVEGANVSTPDETQASTELVVDGYWGALTVAATQRALGTVVDGYVSGQDWRDMRNIGGKPSDAWEIGSVGSQMVTALQRKIGASPDGFFGTNSCRALQSYLGTEIDGVISKPSQCVRELQRRLNAGTF